MNYETYKLNTEESLATDDVLTPSETAVAAGIACGLSTQEVAELNNISRSTATRHIQNIYDKTGIHRGLNALAVWFIEQNLDIDMREIRRRAGAVCLLGLVITQIFTDNNSFVRAKTTRTPSASSRRVRTRNEDNTNTFNYGY